MPQVKWLPAALLDLERLHDFLKDKSPEAAAKAAAAILAGSTMLQDLPELGRPMPDETGRRELFIPFAAGAYVLRYKRDNTAVIILRVWHSLEIRTDQH